MWAVACSPGSARSIPRCLPTDEYPVPAAASGGVAKPAPVGQTARTGRTISVVTMRDELGDGRPESGGPPAVPPWSPRRAGAQPGPSSNGTVAWSPAAGGDTRTRRGSRRGVRLLLGVGLLAALAGLVVSAGAGAIQFLPRHFSAAQRNQIMAWEVGKRWRSWPAGRIFSSAIGYELPGSAFGGGPSLPLETQRVGIARQASCRDATARRAGRLLVMRGCMAVL